MKKLITSIVFAIAAICTHAQTFEYEGINYNVLSEADKTCEVAQNPDASGDITIPEAVTYNNSQYTVAAIGQYAFDGCSSLNEITLPENVSWIGDYAFWRCSNLASITLPQGITAINYGAFRDCSSLTEIILPENVSWIYDNAFSGCQSLTSINVAEGNNYYASIDGVLFSKDLNTLIIYPGGRGCEYSVPKGVTSIGNGAFRDCSSLTEIVVPEGVTTIGEWAFNGCTNLASINIPQGITAIENSTFGGCSSLTEIDIPAGVKTIGISTFRGCSKLVSINIPENVTSIGSYAFMGCSNLVSINIPQGITAIGNYTLYGCSSLTEIDIPVGVKTIGKNAFSSCKSLASINLPDGLTSIGEWAFNGCTNLASINIPQGITAIQDYTFFNCESLTEITLPENITSIGSSAFFGCSSLVTVNSYATNPPVCGADGFYEIPSDATLHVPVGTRDVYAVAYGWSVFTNIIDDLVINEDEPDTCVSMSVSDNSVELIVNEETELIVSLKGLKVGTSTLTLTLTDESGEEITETVFISVVKDTTDVEALFADEEDVLVNIYTLNGILLKTNVRPETVLELPKGIYIVGDKKVLVK